MTLNSPTFYAFKTMNSSWWAKKVASSFYHKSQGNPGVCCETAQEEWKAEFTMQEMVAFSLGLMDGLSSAKTTRSLLLGHTKMVNRETVKPVK